MKHPYAELIEAEAKRADDDLSSMRSRALSIVQTSSGIVTLIAGLTTFAASKVQEERGLPDLAIVLLGIALAGFVLSAIFDVCANRAHTVNKPIVDGLTAPPTWYGKDANGDPDTPDQERVSAAVLISYITDLRKAADRVAGLIDRSVIAICGGMIFASAAVIVSLLSY